MIRFTEMHDPLGSFDATSKLAASSLHASQPSVDSAGEASLAADSLLGPLLSARVLEPSERRLASATRPATAMLLSGGAELDSTQGRCAFRARRKLRKVTVAPEPLFPLLCKLGAARDALAAANPGRAPPTPSKLRIPLSLRQARSANFSPRGACEGAANLARYPLAEGAGPRGKLS